MRQGLFAIVLIFAAFFGGALVNGPGLEWGRQHLASLSKHLPTQFVQGTEESVEDETAEEATDNAVSLKAGKDNAQMRSARSFLPVADASPFAPSSLTPEETPPREFIPPEDSGVETAPTVKAPLGPTIATQSSPLDAAAPDPSTATPRDLPEPPPSLLDLARRTLSDRAAASSPDQEARIGDTTLSPKNSSEPTASSSESSEIVQADTSTASEGPPDSIPPVGDATSPAEERPQPPAVDSGIRLASRTSETQDQTDWAEVRAQMEELGVGRYWVEGDFGGSVIFRCVVPMIGDRAVSQHFEAEGNDLISAARVALRRIALWRATEELP